MRVADYWRTAEDRWWFFEPNAYLYGACLVCGAPRIMVVADLASDKTGTFHMTKSLQCSEDASHRQH